MYPVSTQFDCERYIDQSGQLAVYEERQQEANFDYRRYYRESEKFNEYEKNKNRAHQNLWIVDHRDFGGKLAGRFEDRRSSIFDNFSECNGGPFGDCPVPKGMVKFINYLLHHIEGSAIADYTRIEDVARYMLSNMDFCDAYAPFTNMPVKLVPNQLYYTYKHKATGSVLDPREIEVFAFDPNWTFEPYRKAIEMLKHPAAIAAFRGTSQTTTIENVIDHISTIVWDGKEFLDSWVYEWMENYYDSELPCLMSELENKEVSKEQFQRSDFLFWKTAVLGAFIWLRSPNSLPFLCEYHPIYGSILKFDHITNLPEVVPGSGGEAIVDKFDVFTHAHLTVLKNSPPGTCDNCNIALHCTKLVNANAVAHPKCSCGQFVDPSDTEFWSHPDVSYQDCAPYKKAHPVISAFACRRCLGLLIEKREPTQPCPESQRCPNTACPYHAGASHYMKTLNDRRKLMLTQRH